MVCFACLGKSAGVDGDLESERHRAKAGAKGSRLKSTLSVAAELSKVARASEEGDELAVRRIAVALEDAKDALTVTENRVEAEVLKPRLEALHACLDASWTCLIEALDPGRAKEPLDWSTTSLKGIQECFFKTVSSNDMLRDIRYSTRLILDVFSVYHDQVKGKVEHERGTKAVPPLKWEIFHNSSINQLMKYVSITLSRTVTQLSHEDLQRNKRQFGEILQQLGLGSNVQCVLEPDSVATLIYLLHHTDREERKLVVPVYRERSFESSFATFEGHGQHIRGERCKLFPQFYDERCAASHRMESGEGHGPRKEFFDLASRELAEGGGKGKPGAGPCLFEYSRSMGRYWFSLSVKESSIEASKYFFVGWLMAQTFFNKTKMHIDFAPVIFERILRGDQFSPTMETLLHVDPEAARSIRNVEKLPQADFEAMLEFEGKSGMSKDEFIHHSVRGILLDGVKWQFDSLCRGFHSLVKPSLLQEYYSNGEALASAICGENTSHKTFNVRDVFLIVPDEELESQWKPLSDALWDTVDAWPSSKKLNFVKFVTGSDRLPLPQTETLKVELPFFAFSDQDHSNLLKTLPQAHTCENLLELPNYWESLLKAKDIEENFHPNKEGLDIRKELRKKLRRILDERLTFAISNCDSYELDTLSSDGRFESMPSVNTSVNGVSNLESHDHHSPLLEKKAPVEFLVTHDDIEYLSEETSLQEFQDSPETPLPPISPMSQDYLQTPTSKEKEKETPKGSSALALYDSTIDQMVDELGIEL